MVVAFLYQSDYLGTPTHAYNSDDVKVWEQELDIYGNVKSLKGNKDFCKFRFAGQIYDPEIDLCYNRLRYYDCNTGTYISQDPLRIKGNNPTIYGFVYDVNTQVDLYGMEVYDLIATTDGLYPVYTKGKLNPTSYIQLKAGDIYKIGESQNSKGRYSQTRLDEARINSLKQLRLKLILVECQN